MNKYGWIPALAAVCLLAAGGAAALTTLEEVQKAIAESGAGWTAEENEISARGEEAFRAMLGLLPGEPSPDAPAYVAPFGRDLPSALQDHLAETITGRDATVVVGWLGQEEPELTDSG